MSKPALHASCHCGAVRLESDTWPSRVTSCNCSICRRYGALWAYFTRQSARLVAGASAVYAYVWGDRTIEFFHCKTCGCASHYESIEKDPGSRFAINARMLPPELIVDIRVRRFDGASSWRYLDE